MPEIIHPEGSPGGVASRLAELSDFPFYGVLLYEPPAELDEVLRGLDELVRDYVVTNWNSLNAMTGEHLALVVLDDITSLFSREAKSQMGPSPEAKPFRREQVYEAADMLGVNAAALPCLYLFSGSRSQKTNRALVVELREFVPSDAGLDELRQFFRVVATACKTVSEDPKAKTPAKRLRKLDMELGSGGVRGTVTSVRIREGAETVAAILRVVAETLRLVDRTGIVP